MHKKKEGEENTHIDPTIKDSETSKKYAPKKHEEILKEQIGEGREIYGRGNKSVFISSVTAGLEIGFSFLLMCTVFSFFNGKFSEETTFKLFTFVYPLGFIMAILGKSILFTEQTSLLALPVFNGTRRVGGLMKWWGIVILGNLFGGYVFALAIIWLGPNLGLFELVDLEKIALHVIQPKPQAIFLSAVLAGWLMALLSWLVTSSKDTVSRLLIIYIVTAVIAFTGLHHSILGSTEVFAGTLTSPKIGILDYFEFLILALFGNSVGGVVFVAILKYRAFTKNIE